MKVVLGHSNTILLGGDVYCRTAGDAISLHLPD
jgi:hypothetical protein